MQARLLHLFLTWWKTPPGWTTTPAGQFFTIATTKAPAEGPECPDTCWKSACSAATTYWTMDIQLRLHAVQVRVSYSRCKLVYAMKQKVAKLKFRLFSWGEGVKGIGKGREGDWGREEGRDARKREICDVKSFILYDPLPFGTLAEKTFSPILHQIENETWVYAYMRKSEDVIHCCALKA